jgi:hypothetical protein
MSAIFSRLLIPSLNGNQTETIFTYEGSGSLTLSGEAESFVVAQSAIFAHFLVPSLPFPQRDPYSFFTYEGSGTLTLYGEAETVSTLSFKQTIKWNIRAAVSVPITFVWNTGDIPKRWWRVVGQCNSIVDGCTNHLPIQLDDTSCDTVYFYQNILATSVSDVCRQLNNANWSWPIVSIRKFSKLAYCTSGTTSADCPTCNVLEEVPFCDIPQCMNLCLQSDPVVSVGAYALTVYFHEYVGSGSMTLGGSADYGIVHPEYEGSGTLILSGEAEVTSTNWEYEGSGSLILSGEGDVTSNYWSFTGGGTLILSGEGEILSPDWNYTGSGSLVLSGSAPLILFYNPTGVKLILSGSAEYPRPYWGTGSLVLGGSADVAITSYSYTGSGLLVLSGEAEVVSPVWSYVGGLVDEWVSDADFSDFDFGDADFGDISEHITNGPNLFLTGSALVETPDLAYEGSGTLILGGSADCIDFNGEFWQYEGGGSLVLSGDADATILTHFYTGSGTLIFGSSAIVTSTYLGTFQADIGANVTVVDEEVTFVNDSPGPLIVPPGGFVITGCGTCTNLPLTLNFKHNIDQASVLKEFLTRNGLSLSTQLPLYYSKILDSWKSNIHYSGLSISTSGNEVWRITFEWSCTNQFGGENLNSDFWKFSMYLERKFSDTGVKEGTRLTVVFPQEDLCQRTGNSGFSFPFTVNTKNHTVQTSLNMLVNVVTITDNIGLFKSNFWFKNPNLNLVISQSPINNTDKKQDISPIFPEQPLVLVT